MLNEKNLVKFTHKLTTLQLDSDFNWNEFGTIVEAGFN